MNAKKSFAKCITSKEDGPLPQRRLNPRKVGEAPRVDLPLWIFVCLVSVEFQLEALIVN